MRTPLIFAAGLGAALLLGAGPASARYPEAPWCAVVSLGTGNVYWDCRYSSFEQCRPNVLAGNRGFCNVNPAFPDFWEKPYAGYYGRPHKARRYH